MNSIPLAVICLICLYLPSCGKCQENDDYSLIPLEGPDYDNTNYIQEVVNPDFKVRNDKKKGKRRKSYYRKRTVKKAADGNTLTKEYFRLGHSGKKNEESNYATNDEAESQKYDGSYDMLLEAWTEMLNSGGKPDKEDLQKFHYKLGFEAAVDDAKEAIRVQNLDGTAVGRAAVSVMDQDMNTLKSAYTDGYEAARNAVKDGIIDLKQLKEMKQVFDRVAGLHKSSAAKSSRSYADTPPSSSRTFYPPQVLYPQRSFEAGLQMSPTARSSATSAAAQLSSSRGLSPPQVLYPQRNFEDTAPPSSRGFSPPQVLYPQRNFEELLEDPQTFYNPMNDDSSYLESRNFPNTYEYRPTYSTF